MVIYGYFYTIGVFRSICANFFSRPIWCLYFVSLALEGPWLAWDCTFSPFVPAVVNCDLVFSYSCLSMVLLCEWRTLRLFVLYIVFGFWLGTVIYLLVLFFPGVFYFCNFLSLLYAFCGCLGLFVCLSVGGFCWGCLGVLGVFYSYVGGNVYIFLVMGLFLCGIIVCCYL